MIQAFRDMYRPGRFLIWFWLCWLMNLALILPLSWIFHPQIWVLLVSAIALGVALGVVVPMPKWVKR